MNGFSDLERNLAGLSARDRRRVLTARGGVDFTSNDYLGFAAHPALRAAAEAALGAGVPVGSGGSRLLRGNHEQHEALEAEAAALFGAESALFFATGYAANSSLFATLPQSGDLVVHDALVHASAHEGMRLGRGEIAAATHNDVQAFADVIGAWRARGGKGRPWIAVESLYSMDGDRAPLDDLIALADAEDGALIIDEAHATGVFGPDGKGLAAHLEGRGNVISLRTCGKALGCEGALLCGPAVVRDFLVNRGRGLIFSTAPSPLMAAIVRAALRLLQDEPERRAQLQDLISYANGQFAELGAVHTRSQIIPLILGADARAVAAAQALQEAGFDVRAIRPPTVPEGGARLRIAITLNIGVAEVDRLVATLRTVLERRG